MRWEAVKLNLASALLKGMGGALDRPVKTNVIPIL